MRHALAVLLGACILLWPAPAGAAQPDVRLRHLDAVDALFGAGPGRLIAGDRVLFASPEDLFAWPISGGGPRRIARLPDLGAAFNSPTEGGGFVRVEAMSGDRVVVARGEESVLQFTPDSGPGHRVRVGGPASPFGDPAGCGERSGIPAALSGDLLAYVAAPARTPVCPAGVRPAVDGPAILVRDLAADGVVRARVPLPRDGAVDRLALKGDLLAYNLGVRRFGTGDREPAASVHVLDLSAGREILVLPAARDRVWALDDGGGVVAARAEFRWQLGGACLGRLRGLRHHTPADPSGAPLPFTPCGRTLVAEDGVLRFTVARPDGRADVLEHDLAGGATRSLATVAGELLDSSPGHLLVSDTTCTRDDVRVVALAAELPALPSGPRRCPVAVRAPRWVAAEQRLRVAIRCPRGCVTRYTMTIPHARSGWTSEHGGGFRLRRGGRRTLRFRLDPEVARRGRTRALLTVRVGNPAGPDTVVKRRISVR